MFQGLPIKYCQLAINVRSYFVNWIFPPWIWYPEACSAGPLPDLHFSFNCVDGVLFHKDNSEWCCCSRTLTLLLRVWVDFAKRLSLFLACQFIFNLLLSSLREILSFSLWCSGNSHTNVSANNCRSTILRVSAYLTYLSPYHLPTYIS